MPSARLVIIRGVQSGEVVEIPESTVFSIGRESPNHLELLDLAASRRHAAIRPHRDGFMIADLDSANGTRVNGIPIREARLHDGDEVAIGDTVLRFSGVGEQELLPVAFMPGELGSLDTVRISLEGTRDSGNRSQRVLRELTELCREMAATRDAATIERGFLAAAVRITGAGRGMLLRREEEGAAYACAAAQDSTGKSSPPFAISGTVLGEMTRADEAVIVPDLSRHNWKSRESLRGFVCSLAAMPIGEGSHRSGILYLDSQHPNPNFNAENLEVLSAASAIFVLAWENARRYGTLQSETLRLRSETQLRHSMIGDSPAMRDLYGRLAKVAASDVTVLLLGESGTGKEVAARAIHQNSPRAAHPFMAINCALLNDTLLESDLFGHERGAFTGAVTLKRGKLELAEGGTLFLDELGELPLPIQAKLLRVIQEREFQRLGGVRTLKADLRVVAATHRNLEDAVRMGAFREDLYYRLKVITIQVPALRERLEDLPALVQYLVGRCARRTRRRVDRVEPEAMRLLKRHSWPGNIRELENTLEQAIVLGDGLELKATDLPESLLESAPNCESSDAGYYAQLNRAKERILREALDAAGWNFTEAAAALGVNRTYLHRLARNLGVSS